MLFVPGEEMPRGDSRAVSVTERIQAMDDTDVTTTLADLRRRFGHRHRHLEDTWSSHFRLASWRLGDGDDVPADKKLLMGAYFTRELSLEGAALFNPSIVAHPDQSGLTAGETRFVMSLRAVGEGHVSAIEFRTGTIDGTGEVRLDDPGRFVGHGQYSPGPYSKRLFHAKLAERGCDNQAAALVLDPLGPSLNRPILTWPFPRYIPSSCPGRRSGTPLPGCAGWQATTTQLSSQLGRKCPNVCSGRMAPPRPTAWKTLVLSVS